MRHAYLPGSFNSKRFEAFGQGFVHVTLLHRIHAAAAGAAWMRCRSVSSLPATMISTSPLSVLRTHPFNPRAAAS
jgi:hypothetical protein